MNPLHRPGWIHASLFFSFFSSERRLATLKEIGPVVFIGAPGTVLFAVAGSVQDSSQGDICSTMGNESLGLHCPG